MGSAVWQGNWPEQEGSKLIQGTGEKAIQGWGAEGLERDHECFFFLMGPPHTLHISQ